MSERVPGAGTAGRVARLWSDDAPGTATPAGHLVTRECVHWDTVGPHSSPHHVNPQARVQWRVHLDGTDAADDVYCDDPGAPVLAAGDATEIVVRGRRLRVEWLDGDDAAAAWERHGW
ncbi:hypothetical protein [Cellulosimicrobium composti]|uniref:Uncharacterized protein n=1 Tax=Cellulosimicrobium composti TaxID=2672572 RepID=A0ABX0BGP4_9MICO|nr:hypothetical protein [Cellulosimicrobium composti]NDO91276.1 hypothetical protein [Cellulosimicrobium composti]